MQRNQKEASAKPTPRSQISLPTTKSHSKRLNPTPGGETPHQEAKSHTKRRNPTPRVQVPHPKAKSLPRKEAFCTFLRGQIPFQGGQIPFQQAKSHSKQPNSNLSPNDCIFVCVGMIAFLIQSDCNFDPR